MVNEANEYLEKPYAKARALIVHNYLTSWAVGLTTLGAVLALYFTFIQTICEFADAFAKLEKAKFSSVLGRLMVLPFCDPPHSPVFDDVSKEQDIEKAKFSSVLRDLLFLPFRDPSHSPHSPVFPDVSKKHDIN